MKENNLELHNHIDEVVENKNNITQDSNLPNESNIHSNNLNNNNINDIMNDKNNDNNINNSNNIDNNINNNITTNENVEEANNNETNDPINIDEEEEEIIEEKFNPKFTFIFKLFFILNTISYYYTYYKSNKLKNFSLCLWPIINKKQYYRIMSSHFCYDGFLDYFLSILGLFYITKYLEREIGSLYLLLITFYGMILSSTLYLWFMKILILLFNTWSLNLTEQCSFSGIDFCLFLSYFLLKKNESRNFTFNSMDFKGPYLVYTIIFLVQFLFPSAMFVLNISGTFAAFLIFGIFKRFILPKNKWISEMEKFLCLDNNKCFIKHILSYYSINDYENILENVKEFDNK